MMRAATWLSRLPWLPRLSRLPWLFCALLLSIGALTTASAADKIVYVDFDRIYRDSKIITEQEGKLRAEFTSREEELSAMSEEIVAARRNLEKDALVLSDDERNELRAQLEKMERDFVRGRQALVEDRALRFQERRKVIDSEINRLLTALAEQEGYTMVLNPFLRLPVSERRSINHSMILYADPEADVTDKVIELFDEKATIAE